VCMVSLIMFAILFSSTAGSSMELIRYLQLFGPLYHFLGTRGGVHSSLSSDFCLTLDFFYQIYSLHFQFLYGPI
jgi:hypothetical protein